MNFVEFAEFRQTGLMLGDSLHRPRVAQDIESLGYSAHASVANEARYGFALTRDDNEPSFFCSPDQGGEGILRFFDVDRRFHC